MSSSKADMILTDYDVFSCLHRKGHTRISTNVTLLASYLYFLFKTYCRCCCILILFLINVFIKRFSPLFIFINAEQITNFTDKKMEGKEMANCKKYLMKLALQVTRTVGLRKLTLRSILFQLKLWLKFCLWKV